MMTLFKLIASSF